jgi:type II secretory pathway pseudopilin PulG
MDERADFGVSEADYGGAVQSPSPSDDSLPTRLAELRAQLEVLAPPDQARGLETLEEIRQAQERIGTLELMLARAREREEGLTAQSVREQSTIAACETRIAELTALAGQFPESEAARREADVTVAETKKRLALALVESEARQAEIERLRSRSSELEAELAAVAVESVSAAVARAELARVERELNEARDRAYTERRLAAADRRRAAEADLRAIDMHHQLRLAERRLAQLTNEPQPQPLSEEEEPEAPSDAPWPLVSTEADILDLTNERPGSGDPDVIDGSQFCFPLLDEIERIRWDWRRSGRRLFDEREGATLVANDIASLLRVCEGDVSKVTEAIAAWAESRQKWLESEGDEDRSRHVSSIWLALGVKGVGNLFGSIPNDDPTYDPDLAAEGRARGWRG